MSLLRDSLRPPPLASDAAVRRYIELIRAELEPDPLFRRRLRGEVVNRFVAAREGLKQPAHRPSAMGRLGRAVLYSSFALAMSAGGVMAASQQALPSSSTPSRLSRPPGRAWRTVSWSSTRWWISFPHRPNQRSRPSWRTPLGTAATTAARTTTPRIRTAASTRAGSTTTARAAGPPHRELIQRPRCDRLIHLEPNSHRRPCQSPRSIPPTDTRRAQKTG